MSTRKALSTIEYSLLAAVIIGGLLAMQVYLKRAQQGQLQMATDWMAQDPYAPGLMDSHERTIAHQRICEIETAGWGAPTLITKTSGTFEEDNVKRYNPLTDELIPEEGGD
ncbi:MAG: hypothetical protein GF333_07995 [Candidatus Omnitrophica bacterium]|nr:hypothetical protein [Candidatus Omnitrophota bacterium]